MDGQWDIFPRFLYKPEVFPSTPRDLGWTVWAPLGPTTHTPHSRAFKSILVSRMGKCLDGHSWPACVSLPRICLFLYFSWGSKRESSYPFW